MEKLTLIVVLLIVIGMVIGIALASRKKIAAQYDERQLIAQGRGYMWGFFTIAGYAFLYLFADVILETELMDTKVALFLGVILGVTVYAVYCVWKNAYVGTGIHSAGALTSLILVSLSQGMLGISRWMDEGLTVDGKLTYAIVHLALLGTGVITLTAYGLRKLVDRREEQE